jgi:hypothetical protein
MTDTTNHAEVIRQMVDRFLGWKLPADFSPDCGIHYAPLPHPNSWPIGTNLFTATQAKAMFEYVAAASLDALTREAEETKAALPPTYYADQSLPFRVGMMAGAWNRAMACTLDQDATITAQAERIAKLEEALGAALERLKWVCIDSESLGFIESCQPVIAQGDAALTHKGARG